MAPQALVDDMGVDNVAFLLESLGADASELQYLRELVQNAFEAIQRAGRGFDGRVEIDFEEIEGVRKLRITDNGVGMNPEEVRENINRLSASGGIQSFEKNFGIGAKITAGTRNPHGVMYKAWKDGKGSLTVLGRVAGRYGRIGLSTGEDSVEYWTPLDEEDKHEIITDSGVSVVLLGHSGQEDTTQAPPVADVPHQWVAAYLERRYFMIPSGVTLRVRRPSDMQDAERGQRPVYNTVRGQRHYLDANSEAKGRLDVVKEARAHVRWWLLTEEMTKGGAIWNNGGHVAALYQDELYEVRSGSRRTSALKDFGIYTGYGRVVIYVEPTNVLKANTPRTSLILQGGHPIDYADIGDAFAKQMPGEIAAYMAGQVTSEKSNHREAIRKNIKTVEEAFAQARYRRSERGKLDHYEPEDGVKSDTSSGSSSTPSPPRPRPEDITTRIGSEYLRKTQEEREERIRAQKSTEDQMPKILWSTEPTEPAGRAATYVRAQHVVTASTAFSFYRDMLDWALGEAQARVASDMDEETLHSICEDEVRRWFEEALTQAVVALRPLSHSAQWGPMVDETALSDEGLTAAVVSHPWHMMTAIKRGLAGRLGRERKAA